MPLHAEPLQLQRIIELRRMLPKDQHRRRSGKGSRRSFAEIARTMNAEGHTTQTGKAWTASSVRSVIQRERPAWLKG